ncbi:MAG: hypothetical protein JXB04_00470 [Kiritimatiellae bacterium]|nr:hypothetical protein [Kiritimatiellia bacterium]
MRRTTAAIVVACVFASAAFVGAEETEKPLVLASNNILPPPQQIDLVFPDASDNVRVFHIDFVTRNVRNDQTIGIFIRRANGDYWPVPEERLNPRTIPINQKTSTAVEVIGVPRDEPFAICLFALKKRGQDLLREWFTGDGMKEPFKSIAHGIELGTIQIQ